MMQSKSFICSLRLLLCINIGIIIKSSNKNTHTLYVYRPHEFNFDRREAKKTADKETVSRRDGFYLVIDLLL